ncbi:hypothetical protein D3C73_1171880 [compost metagenome]
MAADDAAGVNDRDFLDFGLFPQRFHQIFRILFGQRMGDNQQLFVHVVDVSKRVLQHLFNGLFLFAADFAYRNDSAVDEAQYRPDLQQAADEIRHARAASAHI